MHTFYSKNVETMGQSCTKTKSVGVTNNKTPNRRCTKGKKCNLLKDKSERQGINITGLAITKNGQILMVDDTNEKIKLFNEDMKQCSSVSVPGAWDIDVINENEAAVGGESCLTILNIDNGQLTVKTTTELEDNISGVSRCKDKLVVTFPDTDPACVKLIDQSGKEYWSLSSGQDESALFKSQLYATKLDETTSKIIVTDRDTNSLTVIDGDTGDIVTRHQTESRGPFGVTTDNKGYVYVCYWDSREVAVLSEDLKEETILLSKENGLGEKPQAIVYDSVHDQLVISYFMCDYVDRFILS